MSNRTKRLIAMGMLLAVAVALVMVAASTSPAPASAQAAAATATPTLAPTPTMVVPFVEQWSKSPHNDVKSLAFTDWDETETKEVPATCAECHSTPGYLDFLGADGSKVQLPGQPVDKAHKIGTTVQCVACHNEATQNLSSVTFLGTELAEAEAGAEPKAENVVISGLGAEARCMVCHQGRAAKSTVDARLAQFEVADEDAVDTVVEPLPATTAGGNPTAFSFINIHYYAAAATLYGSEVHGGYEYEGKTYDVKFDHVPEFDTCVECHDPHTTQVRVQQCAVCHTGKTTAESLRTIRMVSSVADYDGDGNVTEGMDAEIKGLQAVLYKSIQGYAKDVAKTGIVYDKESHPYFFTDKDNNNVVDKNDKGANVRYTTFTPRLLKAAYNYQVSLKDPGAFAHGNKYIVQLLFDSIEDLNAALPTKVDMSKMQREDPGHFAGNTEAFRHWDAEGKMVPGSCARCHSAAGLPQFIANGGNIAVPASNGFQCSTCHVEGEEFPALLSVTAVPFPSGAKLGFGEEGAADPANLCLECHQGRESTVSVNKAIGENADDTATDKLSFRNVHYFAAGATLFGSEAQGIYQYEGKDYAGRFMHVPTADTCVECHDKHQLAPKTQLCTGCHQGKAPEEIRMKSVEDYDGDGDVEEGIAGEVEGMQEVLFKAIQAYAKDNNKAGIIYDALAYPYFMLDKDNDGKPDKNERGGNQSYNAWSPRLLRAAYNYQYSVKDPGAYVHNGVYVLQALYDSIEDLNSKLTTKIDISKLVRPAAAE